MFIITLAVPVCVRSFLAQILFRFLLFVIFLFFSSFFSILRFSCFLIILCLFQDVLWERPEQRQEVDDGGKEEDDEAQIVSGDI